MSPAPSAGTYGYEPHVTYFYGIPCINEPGGVGFEVFEVVCVDDAIVRTSQIDSTP